MKWRGFSIDSSLFNIKLNPPQNFASYRQTELDATRIAAFVQLEPLPYLSKRFLLQRYLGLTKEEMVENEQMWKEEHAEPTISPEGKDMRSVGVTPGGMETDIDAGDQFGAEMGADEMGDQAMDAAGGGAQSAPPVPGPPNNAPVV